MPGKPATLAGSKRQESYPNCLGLEASAGSARMRRSGVGRDGAGVRHARVALVRRRVVVIRAAAHDECTEYRTEKESSFHIILLVGCMATNRILAFFLSTNKEPAKNQARD